MLSCHLFLLILCVLDFEFGLFLLFDCLVSLYLLLFDERKIKIVTFVIKCGCQGLINVFPLLRRSSWTNQLRMSVKINRQEEVHVHS